MAKIDSYYIQKGQASKEKLEEEIKRKKAKQRQKRIKQNVAQKEQDFDLELEEAIKMSNKNKIKKEVQQQNKINKEEKKRQNRKKKIRLLLELLLLLGIIIGSVTFAMVSPIFNIQDIQVKNNNQVSSETIISLSELKIEENIFRFSSSNVSNKIKENAYIENVQIHRIIPSSIEIEVEEREHIYSADFLGKYAYLSKQGYILEIAEDSKQKIIIQGISTQEEQISNGNRLNQEDLEKLEDIIKIMNAAKEYKLDAKITSIDITDKNQYSIYLEEEKKKIHLGDNTNLSNKMLYSNAIIEKEKGKAGEIFANGDLNSKFRVYFRESLV